MVEQGQPLKMRLQMGGFLSRQKVSRREKPTFEEVWQTARPRVWGLTARLAGNADAADDLTQEIAVQALRGYDTFRGNSSTLTWLFRIAINTVMRYREKTQLSRTSSSSISLEDLEDLDSVSLAAPPSEQPENRLLESESAPRIRRG